MVERLLARRQARQWILSSNLRILRKCLGTGRDGRHLQSRPAHHPATQEFPGSPEAHRRKYASAARDVATASKPCRPSST